MSIGTIECGQAFVANKLQLRRFVVALLLAISAANVHAQAAQKKAAMDWAVEHRAEVFDALMGLATRDTVDADTVSFSLRSPGFEDKVEFSITVVKTNKGGVSGD